MTRTDLKGKPKATFASRLGISGLLTLLVACFLVVFGSIAAYIALSKLYKEKATDVWAILYLEMEREIRTVEKKLQVLHFADSSLPLSAEALTEQPPDAIVSMKPRGSDRFALETGWLGKKPRLETLDFMRLRGRQQRFNLWGHNGRTYLARFLAPEDAASAGIKNIAGRAAIVLWKIDAAEWFASAGRPLDGVVAYAANREGHLVFASTNAITAATVGGRQLVQEFVKSPLSQGQLQIETDEAGDAYGMFAQVGDSNIILFKEVPTDVVMAPVRRMAVSFAGTLTLVLLFGLIILQFPMIRLVNPLTQLAGVAREIGRGNLNVRPVAANFGELRVLSETFRSMVDGLVRRDQAIARFVEEQKEAVRLQGELKVAQGIQATLLPKSKTLEGSGVDLSAHYSPAAECAGDWYSYDYNAETGEILVAIADVSGHGAGSAMFTAVIAGLFEQARLESRAAFDSLAFFRQLNKVMMKMGGRAWHTTFTIIRYYRGSDEVEIANAGGTPIFVVKPNDKGGGVAKSEILASDLLGLADTETFALRNIPFPRGSCLFLHTDGLTEAVDGDNRMYGRKRLRRTLETVPHAAPSAVVNRIVSDWNAHRGNVEPDDDLCLIALKRAAR